jgi:NAD(P)-dependent dehydrogenase (short-subunit alcohol dehydrogenase family)
MQKGAGRRMTKPGGRLKGKVAVITGGTSGIGRAATMLFLREGARVVASSNDPAGGAQLISEVPKSYRASLAFVDGDVSKPEAMEDLIRAGIDAFGRLDVIFGNAGTSFSGTAEETSPDDWQRVISVNLAGHFYLVKYAIPELVRVGGGSIILTASELGLIGGRRLVAYCAAKGGVVAMARALAVDCAPQHIRVNCLAPGPIRTPMIEQWFKDAPDPLALRDLATRPVLLGRLGEPEEVAQAALFLASDESSFITGSVLVVDGGVTSWAGM